MGNLRGKKISVNAIKLIFFSIIFVLTLLPLLRIVYILSTTGAVNPTNDDLDFVILIDQILNGDYHWINFFKDTFYYSPYWPASTGHSDFFPALIQVTLAHISDKNLYIAPLYIGLFLFFLKLILIFDIFTLSIKSRVKWAFLPLLSFLVFSVSQISTFEFGLASIEQGLTQGGFVLGIWGLCRFRNRWLSIILMFIGGILATWSWGTGPLVWPIFLLGMILLNYKKIHYYVIWFWGMVFSTLPYFYFLVLKHPPGEAPPIITLMGSLLNFPFIIKGLGWPFQTEFSPGEIPWEGILGLLFGIIGICLLFLRKNKSLLTNAIPALLLMVYGFSIAWLISIFRSGLAPWYRSPFLMYWIGVLGLFFLISLDWFQNKFNITEKFKKSSIAIPLLGLIYLCILSYFYFQSNINYRDKAFYLLTRGPYSASCLRKFSHSPTYCEQSLFLYEPGQLNLFYQMASPLRRHNLSVFAPKQVWTLQGEFGLSNVKVIDEPNIPPTHWTDPDNNKSSSFRDFKHLNLFLHSPNSIEWTVSLPENLKSAVFNSAAAINKGAPSDPNADGVVYTVSIETPERSQEEVLAQYLSPNQKKWKIFKISLREYAGKTITIRLGSRYLENPSQDWVTFRFPYIEIEKSNNSTQNVINKTITIKPSNTDSNSLELKVNNNKNIGLNGRDEAQWKIQGMVKGDGPMDWEVGAQPQMEYKGDLNVCLNDYSHLVLGIAAPTNVQPRAAQVLFQLDGQSGYQRDVWIPLISDNNLTRYTYDLRLLEIHPGVRLTGIKINPIKLNSDHSKEKIEISEISLVRKNRKTLCGNP